MSQTYCINALPQFVVPSNHNPRPAFSQRCGRASQRCLNEHRARAMQALMAAISHFFNISTGLVHCTVEKLAELCGLVTVSKNGNRSITRASRCIRQMECFELLQCENQCLPFVPTIAPQPIKGDLQSRLKTCLMCVLPVEMK